MDLQERPLKGIFRQSRVAEVTPQVTVQLALVPLHEALEGRTVPCRLVPHKQLFVGQVT